MTLEATRPDRLRRIAGWRSLRRAPDSIFPAWDSLLGLQTELFLPYELAFLLACPRWSTAQSVLGIGCILQTNGSFDFSFDETRIELGCGRGNSRHMAK